MIMWKANGRNLYLSEQFFHSSKLPNNYVLVFPGISLPSYIIPLADIYSKGVFITISDTELIMKVYTTRIRSSFPFTSRIFIHLKVQLCQRRPRQVSHLFFFWHPIEAVICLQSRRKVSIRGLLLKSSLTITPSMCLMYVSFCPLISSFSSLMTVILWLSRTTTLISTPSPLKTHFQSSVSTFILSFTMHSFLSYLFEWFMEIVRWPLQKSFRSMPVSMIQVHTFFLPLWPRTDIFISMIHKMIISVLYP